MKSEQIQQVAAIVDRHYDSSKWNIVVAKVIKPAYSPLGAVIGNYSLVDQDGQSFYHIVINDVKNFSIAEEIFEEDDELIGMYQTISD